MAKINRNNRKVLHGLWPQMVMGPLYSVRANAEYHTRVSTFGTGLTKGERRYVEDRLAALIEITEDLQMIYTRLKK